MACFRLFLVAFLLTCAGGAVVSPASGDEWPLERQFPLVEPPPPVHESSPPSSVVEGSDGALFVFVFWPMVGTTNGAETASANTSLVRIAPDGSRAFVPPFGPPGSKHRGGSAIEQVDDEALPLRDGSILFTRFNEIDRVRPDGSTVRFAGTGRYNQDSSGDGGPATAAASARRTVLRNSGTAASSSLKTRASDGLHETARSARSPATASTAMAATAARRRPPSWPGRRTCCP